MSKYNRNPNVRKDRKWGKNVGDPNNSMASGGKKKGKKE